MNVYKNKTKKPLPQFVQDLQRAAKNRGFKISNSDKMNMADVFNAHAIDVPEGFDVHMMQLSKPEKASNCMFTNPERAILIPKFIIAFSANDNTQVRFLHYSEKTILNVVNDVDFPKSIIAGSHEIIAAIEDAIDNELKEAR
jgi:hypothetical protein